jgi:energy-coupling factor transporter ATP-binding protein EcfA2
MGLTGQVMCLPATPVWSEPTVEHAMKPLCGRQRRDELARISVPPVNIKIGIDGFEGHDLLGRAESGKRLSDLIERIEEPLVIALDGRWGSGKSFFLQCWTGAHTKENGGTAKVIYFDAFESDYLTDPLIALVAEIDRHLEPETQEQQRGLAQVKGAVERLWRPFARIGVAAMAGGAAALAGSPDAAGAAAVGGAAMADAIGAAGAEATGAIDVWGEAKGQRDAMERFREGLTKLTAPAEEGGPARKLVLVIDELDRCRPDYALSIIEIAKHFFAVDNVHFVLGANMTELQNSVRARYGSGIDAQRYLHKFVSTTLVLPQQTGRHDPEGVASRYLMQVAAKVGLEPGVAEVLGRYFNLPSLKLQTTPRDVQRILRQLALVPGGSAAIDNKVHAWKIVLVGLAILRAVEPHLFEKVRAGTLAAKDIADTFLAKMATEEDDTFLVYVEQSWRAFIDVSQGQGLPQETKSHLFGGQLPRYNSELARLAREHFDQFQAPPPVAP